MRVAVVGAGIAGTAAAWALHRSGFDVHLFERNPRIGGNAKTHTWAVGESTIETGLSVLAWPPKYFHNYSALLGKLHIPTEEVSLPFFLNHGGDVYAHGRSSTLGDRYATDFARFDRLRETIRRTSTFFARDSARASLYTQPVLSPFNFVPARRAMQAAGISSDFFRDIFVAIHSSSFLTTALAGVPSVILPALDDLMPLGRTPRLTTWSGASSDVFHAMTRDFEPCVHTSAEIRSVRRDTNSVTIADDRGDHRFDRLIFGCPATTALDLLDEPTSNERRILGRVEYVEAVDPCFVDGRVHSDIGVIPARHRDEVLGSFANYIETYRDATGKLQYENTFVLSSWVPRARGHDRPMLVTYNSPKRIDGVERIVDNRRAHPVLSAGGLVVVGLLRFLQGRRNTYYCGSYTTPGNGHDLSLLSGLVVANALGADYPFPTHDNALADFEALRQMMFGMLK